MTARSYLDYGHKMAMPIEYFGSDEKCECNTEKHVQQNFGRPKQSGERQANVNLLATLDQLGPNTFLLSGTPSKLFVREDCIQLKIKIFLRADPSRRKGGLFGVLQTYPECPIRIRNVKQCT